MAPSTYQQQPLADKSYRDQNVVWDSAVTKLELESRPRRGDGKLDEKKAVQNGRTSITIKFLRCGTLSMTIRTNELGMCSKAKMFAERRQGRGSKILVTVHGMKVRNAMLAFPTSTHTAEHNKYRGEASVPAMHNDTMMYEEGPPPERLFAQRGQAPKFPSTV